MHSEIDGLDLQINVKRLCENFEIGQHIALCRVILPK